MLDTPFSAASIVPATVLIVGSTFCTPSMAVGSVVPTSVFKVSSVRADRIGRALHGGDRVADRVEAVGDGVDHVLAHADRAVDRVERLDGDAEALVDRPVQPADEHEGDHPGDQGEHDADGADHRERPTDAAPTRHVHDDARGAVIRRCAPNSAKPKTTTP